MTADIRTAALEAVHDGLAVVIVERGGKKPLCAFHAAEQHAADRDVQAVARSAGDAHWTRRRHPCGLYHAFTDPAALTAALDRLITRYGTVNLGVETGRSRLVIVDVDTEAERDAFLAAWTAAVGADMTGTDPTVTSPGSKDASGVWVHSGGGHYWFHVPEGEELPTGGGVLKGEGGWAVIWRDHQVLIPPSSRPEGAYRWTGEVRQLPDWLRKFIEAGAKTNDDHEPAGGLRNGGSVTDWAADHPWASLLEPDGWTDTGRADTCGCPVWTAPGDHASPKSATAHETGCTQYPDEQVNAPLHVWTDSPPDFLAAAGKTISRLNYVAHRDHGGDAGEAMAALGIAGGAGGCAAGDGDGAGAEVARSPRTLPEGFWTARPELAHIRQAAWVRDVSPDAVLYGVLTQVASQLPGDTRVVTSRGAMSLNLFAAMIGGPGACKSTSAQLAAELVPVPEWLQPTGDAVRYRSQVPIGSGEGLVEAFMGEVDVVIGENASGTEKTAKRRRQVRHNASFYVDEGKTLTTLMVHREGSTLGQTVRTAWTGTGTLGQMNASTERTRIANDYALGLLIGYQPETALPLLDGADEGTPQRFMFAQVDISANPDEEPEDPGPLWKPEYLADLLGLITDPASADGVPLLGGRARTAVTLVGSLRARIRTELRTEGRTPPARLDAHRVVAMVKLSALLAILSGRTEITEDDWQLAATMWGTSCAVRDALSAKAARDQRKAFLARTEASAERAAKVEIAKIEAVENREAEQVARRLALTIGEKGPLAPAALRRTLKANRRKFYEEGAEYAVKRGWLAVTEDGRIGMGNARPL